MEYVDERSEAIPLSGRAWSDGNRGMLKIALRQAFDQLY